MNNKAIKWLKRSDEYNRNIPDRESREFLPDHMKYAWFIPHEGGKPEKIVGDVDTYMQGAARRRSQEEYKRSGGVSWYLVVALWVGVIAMVLALSSCSTTSSSRVTNSYVERCGSPPWSYRFNVDRTPAEDAAMENSARRNCLRFSGPDACLTSIEKVSNVDYVVTCSLNKRLLLKGNE